MNNNRSAIGNIEHTIGYNGNEKNKIEKKKDGMV